MKRLIVPGLLAALMTCSAQATPPDFTYQGFLQDAGNPATGTYDFRFTLQYNDGMLGMQIVGTPQLKDDVAVTSGVFTVPLDFGATLMNFDYLLKIEVRPGASSGSYTTLIPDTAIKATPQSQYAENAGFAASIGNNSVSSLSITDGNVQTPDIGIAAVTADKVDSSSVQLRVSSSCAAGSSIRSIDSIGGVECEIDDAGSTITSVNAGTGLTGGGSAGALTIGIANGGVGATQLAANAVGTGAINANQVQVRVNGFCIAGNSIRAIANDGSVTCEADDAGGSGTVTSVASGTGLTGGPITGSGTLSIANGGVGATQIADGSITAADVNTASVQARVTGTCAAGSSIGSIASDGTVACETDDVGITSTTTVTSAYPVPGSRFISTPGTSVGDIAATTGIDGLALIAHYEPTNGDLVVLHCDVPDCSVTTRTIVDSTGDVGRKPRMVIAGFGAASFPLITYVDQTNNVIKALRCSNLACTASLSAAITATAGASPVHETSRNASGTFAVAFHDPVNGNVRAVTCSNYNSCNAPFDIDANVDNVGLGLVMGINGFRYYAYRNSTNNHLILRTCSSTLVAASNCFQTLTLDNSGTVDDVHDLLVTETGQPIVLYRKGGVEYVATCATPTCAAAAPSVSVAPAAASFGAMTVGSDGYPMIVMRGFTSPSDARRNRCSTPTCGSVFIGTFSTGGAAVDARPAIVRSDRDFPIVFARQGDQLMIEVCDNNFCSSESRHR